MIISIDPRGPSAQHPSRHVPSIEAVIARHGAWRVFFVAAKALAVPQRRRAPSASELSAHLRRDVGLAPEADAPGYWTL